MGAIPEPMEFDDAPRIPLREPDAPVDLAAPAEPFPADLFDGLPDLGYLADDDPFDPFVSADLPPEWADDLEDRGTPASAAAFDPEAGWGWHDAALIAVERDTPEGVRYHIGAIDLYANAHTGDLGGSYLNLGTFEELDAAAGLYHELQGEIHDRLLPAFQLVDFAEEQARERGDPTPTWRAAGPPEYAAYEAARLLDGAEVIDLPPEGFEVETLLRAEPGRTFQALRDIGLSAEGFDPEADPPPFVDPQTGTAYWIGVFQPDRDDPDNAVTSILSLARDPDTGAVEAQLAPILPGDWDKAYGAAEYLIGVVEKGGIERAFEAAEAMALAADQRELWEAERGIPLEADTAEDLAAYARAQWEIDL